MAEPTLFNTHPPVKKAANGWSRAKRATRETKSEWYRRNGDPLNPPGSPPLVIPIEGDVPVATPLYAVTRDGRVFSLIKKPRQLKLCVTPNGYLHVVLYIYGRPVTRNLHSLMAEVFKIPKPPGATLIRHLDGNKLNNRLENLAWGTSSQNAHDAIRHGTFLDGRGKKLTIEDVRAIRASLADGNRTLSSLGRQYGVSYVLISRIRDGLAWRRTK